jgi:single-stranded-DNA-specific exonuclease
MQTARHAFMEFGGHSAAGGFSVAPDAVFALEEHLVTALATMPTKEAEDPFSKADAHIATHEATPTLLSKLERLAPFGMGNAKPTFSFKEVVIAEVSWFGKAEEHLRVRIRPSADDFTDRMLEGIAFYAKRELGKVTEELTVGMTTNILATIERDQFTKGRPVRLRLVAVG